MFPFSFFDRLVDEINEQTKEEITALSRRVPTWEEYQYKVGRIDGLNAALETLADLRVKYMSE